MIGLINIQYGVAGGELYVIEANPRASRTVPFVSKAIGVPLAKIACRLMLGERLADQELPAELPTARQHDILINNAGIFEPKGFFDIPDEDWTRFYEVNVMSGVRLSRAYMPGMLKRNWGRVVFISSNRLSVFRRK